MMTQSTQESPLIVLMSSDKPGAGITTQSSELATRLGKENPDKKILFFSAGAFRRALAALYTNEFASNWTNFEKFITTTINAPDGTAQLYAKLAASIAQGCDEATLAAFNQAQNEVQKYQTNPTPLDALPDKLAYHHILNNLDAAYIIFEGKLATELLSLVDVETSYNLAVLRIFLSVSDTISAARVLDRELKKQTVTLDELASVFSNTGIDLKSGSPELTRILETLRSLLSTYILNFEDTTELEHAYKDVQTKNPLFSHVQLTDIVAWFEQTLQHYSELNKNRITRDTQHYQFIYGQDAIKPFEDRINEWKTREPDTTFELEVAHQTIEDITAALMGMVTQASLYN
jgi:cytidylate kinase